LRPIRIAATFATLLLASAVAAPSVGAFQEKANAGSTGLYTIPDEALSPGAVCRYENNPGKRGDETNRISSRLMWTHGPGERMSWVGHRIIIKKKRGASYPWKTAWKSPITKQRASDSEVAFFKAKHYRTPESHNKRYRLVVELTFYTPGSKTKQVGRVRGAVEVHKHALSGQSPYRRGEEGGPVGWCRKTFWQGL
jgi:hypothetical protein